MRMTLILAASLICSGCGQTDTPSDKRPGATFCERAWEEIGQGASMSKEVFITRCRDSAWVSQCGDGSIEFSSDSGGLCRNNGGVRSDLKFPDG